MKSNVIELSICQIELELPVIQYLLESNLSEICTPFFCMRNKRKQNVTLIALILNFIKYFSFLYDSPPTFESESS